MSAEANAEGSEHICPISKETGVFPRRSIELHPNTARAAGKAIIRHPDNDTDHQQDHVRPPAPSTSQAQAPLTGLLTADGRLSLKLMHDPSGAVQRSSSLHKAGSLTLGSFSSRSPPAAALSSPSSSSHGCPAGSSSVTWHKSASWGLPERAASAGGAVTAVVSAPEQPAAAVLADPEQHQVAAACYSKDAKLLQQLLARGVSTVHALDADGNTALHLVLSPHNQHPQATTPAAAASAATTSKEGNNCNTSSNSSRGGLSRILTACFSVPAVADEGSNSSSHCTSRALSPAAAAAAQLSMVTALLGAGADVNVRNRQGQTPLTLAAQQVTTAGSTGSSSVTASALKVLEVLCNYVMTDPNMKDGQGRTALVLVLQAQPLQLISTVSNSSTSSTSTAVKQQQKRAASASAGGSGAAALSSNGTSSSSSGGFSSSRGSMHSSASAVTAAAAMSPAASAAQLKAVQMLLHAGADCNAADHAGMTPLMHAAAQPSVTKELLQLLLERGTNTRQLDNCRRSALTHAILAHNLKLLPALGLDPRLQHDSHCCSCLRPPAPPAGAAASASGGFESGELIGTACNAATAAMCSSSSNSSSIGCSSSNGCTADCTAHMPNSSSCHHSNSHTPLLLPNPAHSTIIRALCSYGAVDLHPCSINTRFPGLTGFSQLHIAMRRGDVLALQMLLAGGADMNALDSWGNSPLMYWPVAPSEPVELVEELVGRLLSHGADPNLANHDGWAPLDLACDLNKLGKVVVKQHCVPVHALLVGWGAKNSSAFKAQNRNPPQLLCMRTDSANSFIRSSKGWGSLKAVSHTELEQQVAALRQEDTSA